MRCLSAKRHWRNKLTRYYTTQLCPSRFAGLLRSRFSVKTRHETDEQSQLPMSTFGVPEASAKRRSEPPLFQKLADTHIDVGKPLQTHPPPTHFTLTRTPTSSHTFHERTLAHNSKRYPPPSTRHPIAPSAPFAWSLSQNPEHVPQNQHQRHADKHPLEIHEEHLRKREGNLRCQYQSADVGHVQDLQDAQRPHQKRTSTSA